MTDGFSGYSKLSNPNRCCCYAHLRRYFIDSIPAGKENDRKHSNMSAHHKENPHSNGLSRYLLKIVH